LPEAIDAESPVVALGGRSSRPKTFRLIQVLRAVAALMVVAHHATILVEQRWHRTGVFWAGGAAGVDIFFVISGLVMTMSAQRVARSARGAWTFFQRRLERVVPLYWIATTTKVLLALALPALAINANGTVWHVVASYLFIPSLSPAHTMEPMLVVGWTLEIEMLFYLLYGASFLLRISPWCTVAPAFLALAYVRFGAVAPDSKVLLWGSTLNFEFLWGMALGACVLRGRYPATWLSAGLLVLGGALLFLTPLTFAEVWRPIVWGLPATAIVAGALGLERCLREAVPALVQRLGDASYSIYLTHGLVLPLLGAGLSRITMKPGAITWLVMVLGLFLSSVVGLACYQWLELPMLRWFQLRRKATPLRREAAAT